MFYINCIACILHLSFYLFAMLMALNGLLCADVLLRNYTVCQKKSDRYN